MKKSFLFFFTLVFLHLCISCQSVEKSLSYQSSMGLFERYSFVLKDVSLSVDLVSDPELTNQFSKMLETEIAKVNGRFSAPWKKEAYVNVSVVERSLRKNFREKKSLSLQLEVFNSEGKVLLKHGLYFHKNQSVLSSLEQLRLVKESGRILRSIK